MNNEKNVGEFSKIVTETVAAHATWEHYKKNKSLFVPNIREHYGYIVEQLIHGLSAEQAFSQFVKVTEPNLTKSKTNVSAKISIAEKQARPPWPFFVQSFVNTDTSNAQPQRRSKLLRNAR